MNPINEGGVEDSAAGMFEVEDRIGKMLRSGDITPSELRRFISLSADERKTLFCEEEFVVRNDLGVITVPSDYDHNHQLRVFFKDASSICCDPDITDEHFPNPTRIMNPDERFHVKIFEQVGVNPTTTDGRIAFLKGNKAVFLGAQGISLVFSSKKQRSNLPNKGDIVSYDETGHLWIDRQDVCRIPILSRSPILGSKFLLGPHERLWIKQDYFFGFFEVE